MIDVTAPATRPSHTDFSASPLARPIANANATKRCFTPLNLIALPHFEQRLVESNAAAISAGIAMPFNSQTGQVLTKKRSRVERRLRVSSRNYSPGGATVALRLGADVRTLFYALEIRMVPITISNGLNITSDRARGYVCAYDVLCCGDQESNRQDRAYKRPGDELRNVNWVPDAKNTWRTVMSTRCKRNEREGTSSYKLCCEDGLSFVR